MSPPPMMRVCTGLVCALGLLLGGCAALKETLRPASTESPSPVRLEVVAPASLKEMLETHLDLARLPKLAAAGGVAVEVTEIDRLVQAAPEQARDLVATEGYFDPVVTAERAHAAGAPDRSAAAASHGRRGLQDRRGHPRYAGAPAPKGVRPGGHGAKRVRAVERAPSMGRRAEHAHAARPVAQPGRRRHRTAGVRRRLGGLGPDARAQDTKNIDRLYFVQAERSQRRTDTTRETSDALSAHSHTVLRKLDDNLLPTRGQAYALQAGGGVARSNVGESGPFGRLYVLARGFWPIGSWFGQARIELGQVLARGGVVVPESMRFRAGGDNSVRGYAYRSLTPTVNGVETSGKVLFTASVEVARPILAKLPQLWGAAFIDAGRAADRWGDLKPAVGVGVGVRYRSPIGPLRVDLVYGEEVRKFRLHIALGTTF